MMVEMIEKLFKEDDVAVTVETCDEKTFVYDRMGEKTEVPKNMAFEKALRFLKMGLEVRRANWSVEGLSMILKNDEIHLICRETGGSNELSFIVCDDILKEDWELV